MDCGNHNECNKRLRKMIEKIKQEIIKVDKFIKQCNSDVSVSEPSSYKLCKSEKKQIIDAIKTSSPSGSTLIQNLVAHRAEVKYVLEAYTKLMRKSEKIKRLQKYQLDEVNKIDFCLRNDVIPMMKDRDKSKSVDSEKDSKKDSEKDLEKDLVKTFEELLSQFRELTEEYEAEDKRIADRLKRIADEDRRDKILFSLVIKCVRRAFDIQAKFNCKQADFMQYAFSDSQCEDTEVSDNFA